MGINFTIVDNASESPKNQQKPPQIALEDGFFTKDSSYRGDFYEKDGEKIPNGDGYRKLFNENNKQEIGTFYDGRFSHGKTLEETQDYIIEANGFFGNSDTKTNTYNISSGEVRITNKKTHHTETLFFENARLIKKSYRNPNNISQIITEEGIFRINNHKSTLTDGIITITEGEKKITEAIKGNVITLGNKTFFGNPNGNARIKTVKGNILEEGNFRNGILSSGYKNLENSYQEGTFDQNGNIITGKYINTNQHINTWYENGKITKRKIYMLRDEKEGGKMTFREQIGEFSDAEQGKEILLNGTEAKKFKNHTTHTEETISQKHINHTTERLQSLQNNLRHFSTYIQAIQMKIHEHIVEFYQDLANESKKSGIEVSENTKNVLHFANNISNEIEKIHKLSQEFAGDETVNTETLEILDKKITQITDDTKELKKGAYAESHEFLNQFIEINQLIQNEIQGFLT